MKILSRFFEGKYKKATLNSRTLTENHPDRGLVTNTYDKSSNLISMNRASIGAISFRYSYNRLLSRTMPGSSGNDLYDVVYTYGTPGDGKNGAGRIVAIDQGQGFKVDHYSYDELGQRVVEQSTIQVPQVGQRTYQTEFKYSSFGRILQASYPDGDVVNYHYTDKGELFSIESTAPGEPKLFVVQETQYNGFGQIGTLIYGNGTKTTYNYASSDFVTSGLGHLNKTALFTSTVEGKATLGGATTSLASRDYQYSNLGMVSSLNKSIHSSLAAGITSLDYSFSYDDKGRLQGSTLATGGMNIYELTMGYNAVGGITSKDSDLPNGGHPLVNPNLKYDLSYSYNPAKPHQLLSVTEVGPNGGITNFSYDDVGNLTESFGPSGTEELIWNELQQLSGVMNGNGIHHYVYDHNGERIMKSSINRSWVQVNDQNVDDIQYLEPYTLYVNPYYVVTSFHNGDHISKHYYMNTQRVATDISINYQGPPPPIAPGAPMSSDSAQSTGMGISASFEDDLNEVLQQFDAGDLSSSLSENGVAMEKYYPNAASESESMNRILYWYHPDYLGSVDLVTDRNGVAYEFFLYTPWGEDMYSYNSGTSNFTSPYRFNGKEKDPETGYHYYGARYYQSKFSIWMSVDPLAHETLEPYVYTGNNPVMLVDPDGRTIIPVHGTWSNQGTWQNKNGIRQACNNLFNDNVLTPNIFTWSGGNFAEYRTSAAFKLVMQAMNEMKSDSFNGQITLVGHSHGGNVAIEALNMMAEMAEFDDVQLNLLTINTPVRDDYQLSDKASSRVNHTNVYDPKDPVQNKGGNMTTVFPPNGPLPNTPNENAPWGEYGVAGRTFDTANNIKVNNPQGLVKGWIFTTLPLILIPVEGDFHNSHNRVDDWIDQTKQ